MICEPGSVVVVPFPFSDLPVAKPRPALVLSSADMNGQTGQTLMAMITTAARSTWPHDVEIEDVDTAGLPRACRIRWKLFSIDNRLISRRTGRLSDAGRRTAAKAAGAVIAL